jgi:hypothetical protein
MSAGVGIMPLAVSLLPKPGEEFTGRANGSINVAEAISHSVLSPEQATKSMLKARWDIVTNNGIK